MSRYEPVDPSNLTVAQQRVHDSIASGPRGKVFGPFTVLLHSPEIADHIQQLGAYIRYRSALSARLRELAILVTSRFWKAEIEWYAHAPIARDEGVSDEVIEAIRNGRDPSFDKEDEAAVYRFCKALHERHNVEDAHYREVQSLLGQEALIDLIAVSGYYTLLAMTLNVYEVPTPDGSSAFNG